MLHSSIQTSVISTFGFSYVALANPVILVHEACGLSANPQSLFLQAPIQPRDALSTNVFLTVDHKFSALFYVMTPPFLSYVHLTSGHRF